MCVVFNKELEALWFEIRVYIYFCEWVFVEFCCIKIKDEAQIQVGFFFYVFFLKFWFQCYHLQIQSIITKLQRILRLLSKNCNITLLKYIFFINNWWSFTTVCEEFLMRSMKLFDENLEPLVLLWFGV